MAVRAHHSQKSTMAADFDRALDMLLTGIQSRAACGTIGPKQI
jgi:hypothetical protein